VTDTLVDHFLNLEMATQLRGCAGGMNKSQRAGVIHLRQLNGLRMQEKLHTVERADGAGATHAADGQTNGQPLVEIGAFYSRGQQLKTVHAEAQEDVDEDVVDGACVRAESNVDARPPWHKGAAGRDLQK